ncbi:hypothetical protein [Novosphingobium album (ex Liu et al. 2023)]|uniref:PRTRC system protein F n=1 Tax=Novosphingobium album (ex Liu et al. 2023) TaxID=3031130 RepID=A0ABT5WQ68_9SPHN|nr:hypothetical protein [Novosphingobium album (ex Liu et al. 2023)]MDE8652156.1 hypothetical protein [Novosphingobium album (ex Liu et al. 2023)]
MTTASASLRLPAADRRAPFTCSFFPSAKPAALKRPNRLPRPQASASPRSADLAGRAVALSPDIPALFDSPLARHHKLIGHWVAAREPSAGMFTRVAARRHIERTFQTAVLEILEPIHFVDLRITVLRGAGENEGALDGDGDRSPALIMTCETMGQLDLGWIETSEAPMGWRAAAYRALGHCLPGILPIFGYDDLFEHIAMSWWDGEIDDEAAREALIHYHGADAEGLDEMMLPSAMEARRPAWMIAANVAPPNKLPAGLREKLHHLREAHAALEELADQDHAWRFDTETLYEYVPGFEECSSLPPLTLVPAEQFAPEIDDIGQYGMEMGFMDVVGLCPLADRSRIDAWFNSLATGVRFLLAAQDLIRFDPTPLRGRHARSRHACA